MQHTYHEDPGKWIALLLALIMHGALALGLMLTVNWQTRSIPVAIEAELWIAPPSVEKKTQRPNPQPLPSTAQKPVPATAASIDEPPPISKPAIALKTPPPPPKAVKTEEKTNKTPSFDDLLAREDKAIDRRKTEESKRQRVDEEVRQLALLREEQEAQSRSAAKARSMADYQSKLRGKIRGNLVQPPNLRGNPIAQFVVTQLPSGEILDVRLKRASSNSLYDNAVERAIRKSSPLPRPDDSSIFARDLELTFCPDEEKGCR